MKNLKVTTTIFAMAFVALTVMSCKDNKKETASDMHNMDMSHHDDANATMDYDQMASTDARPMNAQQASQTKQVLASYMAIKDALVNDDGNAAQKAGKQLETALSTFDVSSYTAEQQTELKDIIADARENAEHISESKIDHQREHFKILSEDMLDMVAITGAGGTIYQLYCPMYDKGSSWLSMSKDIKNPFYGSKMLTCGKVEKEIN